MNIEYRSHYFDDVEAKISFERYAKSLFNLDFGRWEARGLWDEKYVPFSAFVDNECVASICVYPCEMIVDGKIRNWAQLLTVGTLEEYRRMGIQYEIWKRANAWIQENCESVFLFTDEYAAGFYRKLGLKRQLERYDVIRPFRTSQQENIHFRRLDIDDDGDFAILERLAHNREPVSNRLGFKNPNLLLFMFLYRYRDWTYYIEERDTVVVVEDSGQLVRLHDIVAEQMPGFKDLEPFLRQFQRSEIEFLFCTDRLGLAGAVKREVKDDVLFVGEDIEFEGDIVFPFSIRA